MKSALLEHLEMDARITLGVFFDQMAPLDDSMDDEEKDVRDRLRKVVIKFLTEDARKVIVERYAVPGSEAEETLIDNLLEVCRLLYAVLTGSSGGSGDPQISL